ncbi:MAG: hypothetical protein M1829_005258 [Trizodia sp. TS-e1964]|nr:MAG: hypothetical protein M1829_005258 [Trizodia sp. TS-e1964]
MPEIHPSSLCKRPNPEQLTSQQNGSPRHASKKQKIDSLEAEDFQYPPAFYDDLSKIHLTVDALQELDRRNSQAALDIRRTRHAITELKKNCKPFVPADRYIDNCGTRHLRALKQSAKHGGPDLSNLISHPEPPIPSEMGSKTPSYRVQKRKLAASSNKKPSQTTTKTTTTTKMTTKSITPTPMVEFNQSRLTGEDIKRSLSQLRRPLSPARFTEGDFENFLIAEANAKKEKLVTETVIPVIRGAVTNDRNRGGGSQFRNLGHLTDGTLARGNPDIYYGSIRTDLDRQVSEKFSKMIIPTSQLDLPIAPNFFVAAKGPDGIPAVADRQATYDGTLGARGMLSLKTYGQTRPNFDNNASTISCLYQFGILKMFTVLPTQPVNPGTCGYYDSYNDCRFQNWGRWVLFVAIIFGVLFLLFLFSCFTARRRRRSGLEPWRGTGWMAGQTPPGHAPAMYNPHAFGPEQYGNPQFIQPPPQLNAQPQFNDPQSTQPFTHRPADPSAPPNYQQSNHNYFSGQQSGIELQPPQGVYQPARGGENVYEAMTPPGPKPDRVIR